VSQKLVEKKAAREYITDGSNKDLHEADENHLTDAYEAAKYVVDYFPEWESIPCCQDGEILPQQEITQKILTKITQ